MPTPLLIIGDAPTAGTGLGRILFDVSSRVATNLGDVYRIATVGYGGLFTRNLSCHHYTAEGLDGWIIPTLPEMWDDWAGNEKGAVMFISDPARLGWFSRPDMSNELDRYPSLKQFLLKPPFKRWIYAPVDASGPNDRLTFPLAQNLLGFDRILAYGKFGEGVIRRTLGDKESDKRGLTSLPHGIDVNTFYPRNRQTSRSFFFNITGASTLRGEKGSIQPDETLIGIIGTNQSRKDFGMALEAISILSRQRKIRLWIHTDTLERVGCWSIPALLVDFGLADRTVISLGTLSDDNMAKAYSACDLTVGPGVEGFGFPLAESLACGIPVVHGYYGGGANIVPIEMLVAPVAYRYESIWGCKRPVYDPEDWAERVNDLIGKRGVLDEKYAWVNNWKGWKNWFLEGEK